MRWHGVVPVFNDEHLLTMALRSLAWCDVVWVIDGAYRFFPYDEPYSTDSTLLLVRSFPFVRLIPTEEEWVNEAAKRTAGLVGAEGDWYVYLDADEVLLNGPLLKWRVMVAYAQGERPAWVQVPISRPMTQSGHGQILMPRAFRHVDGICFPGPDDWKIVDKDNKVCAPVPGLELSCPYDGWVEEDVHILHFKDLRSRKRLNDVARYHKMRQLPADERARQFASAT